MALPETVLTRTFLKRLCGPIVLQLKRSLQVIILVYGNRGVKGKCRLGLQSRIANKIKPSFIFIRASGG